MKSIPDPIYDGATVARKRAGLGMSQADVANALGLRRETINRMEIGATLIPRASGAALGLLFAWLESEPAPQAAQSPTQAPKPRGRPASLNYAFQPMPPTPRPNGFGGAEVEAMPQGTRYQRMEIQGKHGFGTWDTFIRGAGSRFEDEREAEGAAPAPDTVWLEETARKVRGEL